MSGLSPRDRELVALGAAIGSNCVPCIEYLIPKARELGLTDREIQVAIKQADLVRQKPAQKVLKTALEMLSCEADEPEGAASSGGCGCG
jgi:AhpD family alkylhydroperoxidase